jgi:hypothetical protein
MQCDFLKNNGEPTQEINELKVYALEVQVGTKICRLRENKNNMRLNTNNTLGRLYLSRYKIRVSMQ